MDKEHMDGCLTFCCVHMPYKSSNAIERSSSKKLTLVKLAIENYAHFCSHQEHHI
jgi:hypothetical protein